MTSKPLTRAQREALYRKWRQDSQGMSYREFRRDAFNNELMGCVLVQWCGMVLGIEPDGYTHS